MPSEVFRMFDPANDGRPNAILFVPSYLIKLWLHKIHGGFDLSGDASDRYCFRFWEQKVLQRFRFLDEFISKMAKEIQRKNPLNYWKMDVVLPIVRAMVFYIVFIGKNKEYTTKKMEYCYKNGVYEVFDLDIILWECAGCFIECALNRKMIISKYLLLRTHKCRFFSKSIYTECFKTSIFDFNA